MNAVSLAQLLLVLLTPSTGQSDYGYGGHPDCTPGYDQDCSTPMTFTDSALSHPATPPTMQHNKGSAILPRRSHHSDKTQHREGSPIKEATPSGTVETNNCKMDIPNDCVFPFRYKEQQYSACTDLDAVGTKWCSTSRDYEGSWRECKSTCAEKWPVKSIVGTAVAGGVAAAGLGMAVAATELTRQEKLGSAAPLSQQKPEASSALAPAAHGISVASTTVSVPAAAVRFLDRQSPNVQRPAQANTPAPLDVAQQFAIAAASRNGIWLLVVAVLTLAVCCSVSISGIVAMCLAKREKRHHYMEVDAASWSHTLDAQRGQWIADEDEEGYSDTYVE